MLRRHDHECRLQHDRAGSSRRTPYQHLVSPNGAVNVKFKVQKFVRQGNGLAAVGQAVTTYQPATGAAQTITKSFKATVLLGKSGQQANAICPVLFLSIQKLSLVLLGLHVDLDKVVLTITANSKGGVLGSLFCQIAKSKVKLLNSTGALNKVASQSGLASTGLNFNVPVSGTKTAEAAQAATCQVLDLVLGPIALNLLGLDGQPEPDAPFDHGRSHGRRARQPLLLADALSAGGARQRAGPLLPVACAHG